jgi:lipopolysaccharide biosynthesis glycosyltransferase
MRAQVNRAVVTICLGDEFQSVAQLTTPFMEAYANTVHADFIRIDRAERIGPTHHFEKYQLQQVLDSYDRILYVDADVLIARTAPDLFSLVPQDHFGAYLASAHSRCHDKAIDQIQEALGRLVWTRDYFNSGVMLVGRAHRDVFDLCHGVYLSFYEQTQLNYNVRKLRVPLQAVIA